MKKVIILIVFITGIHPVCNKSGLNFIIGDKLIAQSSTPCYTVPGEPSGFSNWISTAVGNVGGFFEAIGGFFSGGGNNDGFPVSCGEGGSGGEFFAEEEVDDDGNAMPIDWDGLMAACNDIGGLNNEPFSDPYYQNTYGLNDNDTYLLNNLNEMYGAYCLYGCNMSAQDYLDYSNNGNGGGTGNGNPPPPPPTPRYYIILNDKDSIPLHYLSQDTIFIQQQDRPQKLTIKKIDGTAIDFVNILKWKYPDTLKATANINCTISASSLIQTHINVDSLNTYIMQVYIKVYKKPTFYFLIGNNYKGEYGFDDSAHLHSVITNNPNFSAGTQIKNYAPNYRVPWMSLLHTQPTVTIRDSIVDLTEAAKRDRLGFLDLKCNKASKVKFNGSNNLRLFYKDLQAVNPLSVYAEELSSNTESLRLAKNFTNIIAGTHAVTSSSDTIGKLNLSCAKPAKKWLVIVKVNTGNGYNPIDKQKIVDSLNSFSQNQYFREWEINQPNSINGKDTLDLITEFNAHNGVDSVFFKSDTLLKSNYIDKFYENHKGISMRDIILATGASPTNNVAGLDDTSKIHFVFVFNYSIKTTDNGTLGITLPAGYKSLIFVDCIY